MRYRTNGLLKQVCHHQWAQGNGSPHSQSFILACFILPLCLCRAFPPRLVHPDRVHPEMVNKSLNHTTTTAEGVMCWKYPPSLSFCCTLTLSLLSLLINRNGWTTRNVSSSRADLQASQPLCVTLRLFQLSTSRYPVIFPLYFTSIILSLKNSADIKIESCSSHDQFLKTVNNGSMK